MRYLNAMQSWAYHAGYLTSYLMVSLILYYVLIVRGNLLHIPLPVFLLITLAVTTTGFTLKKAIL